MTNEELNDVLFDKLHEEQGKYEQWLLTLSPKEILDHCYEFNVREDILLALESDSLTDEQCKGLLKLPDPLKLLFESFIDNTDRLEEMEVIFSCIKCCADEIINGGVK